MTQGGMYNWRVKSVLDALARQGKAEGPLTVEDLVGLGHLDQYHYLGVTACDHVIELLICSCLLRVSERDTALSRLPVRFAERHITLISHTASAAS